MVDYNHKTAYVLLERTKRENPEIEEEEQKLKKQIKVEDGIAKKKQLQKRRDILKQNMEKIVMEWKLRFMYAHLKRCWVGR